VNDGIVCAAGTGTAAKGGESHVHEAIAAQEYPGIRTRGVAVHAPRWTIGASAAGGDQGHGVMKDCAVIATHHKTGTVWMGSIFRDISVACKLRLIRMQRLKGIAPEALVLPSIVINQHSDFKKCRWMLKHPRCRILHLIRDPRDIVLSAMRHHRTAKEDWLHKPRKAFDGLTYQQKINGLPDDRARCIFEMDNGARRTIRSMRKWNYARPGVIECRYESLIGDVGMTAFTAVLLHLGFEDHELDACRTAIRENSLFGTVKEKKQAHIHSGAARQWAQAFDRSLAAEFIERFGDVLIELGYEKDNAWADALPPAREARETDAQISVPGARIPVASAAAEA